MIKSKVILIYKWQLLILSSIILLFNSCKKTELVSPSLPEGVESDFFNESSNAGGLVKRLADHLKEHNASRHFVKDIANQEGIPVWNKTLSETKNNTTVVLLPLVLKDKKYVNSFILFKIKDEQITSQLVQGGNYDKYTYAADLIAIKFMELNTAVFGATDFVATNKNVFNIGSVETKLGKGPLEIRLTTHDVTTSARPQIENTLSASQQLTTTGITTTGTSAIVLKKCTGVVYMQSGTVVSTSGDLSCGPTIIDNSPGTPITPIPTTPTTPTTPTGGGGGCKCLPANPTLPPVKPVIFITSTDAEPDFTISDYDPDIYWWNDNTTTFPPQALPKWLDVFNNYPKDPITGCDMPAPDVYKLVGGSLLTAYNSNPIKYANACALRVSRALNYSGVTIPFISGQTSKGADGKYYFISSAKLFNWMTKTFGPATISVSKSQGGTNGANFNSYLTGKKGIYMMQASWPSKFGALGHGTLYDGAHCIKSSDCSHYSDYFDAEGGVEKIVLWKLN
ncbi:T6SS effector amidase Tae4 family protein [Ferruginibacter sp. SUN002]|uniref:T6SS effector amidase Tae4 family protein n=1 Tax=Ferruginibacter sp. SUN002 TaxID=2937789 RepID=UPI003D35E2F7